MYLTRDGVLVKDGDKVYCHHQGGMSECVVGEITPWNKHFKTNPEMCYHSEQRALRSGPCLRNFPIQINPRIEFWKDERQNSVRGQYVHLSSKNVVKTDVVLDEGNTFVAIDRDKKGRIVGIEILYNPIDTEQLKGII